MIPSCPLCPSPAHPFAEDAARVYFQCARCALVFSDPATHLDPAAERARYDLHRNDVHDPRYRRFLDRLARPLLARLERGMRGLDYGCGPGPALARMLEDAGMVMALYDPHYAPDAGVLAGRYDFVTCTEVVEHFRHPARDWQQLAALLEPSGWLGVMTQLAPPRESFLDWGYRRDPTHVSFYRPETFAWIADHFGLTKEQVRSDVIVLQRLPGLSPAAGRRDPSLW
jgi:SAM-dependent methyltransferase